MASVPERLAAALASLPFVQLPEGWDGGPINIPGLTGGLPLDDPWDAVVSASAPDLTGDEVRFAVDANGVTITGGDVSIEALQPLAQAVAQQLAAPFWAVAVPDEDDTWTAAGTSSEVLQITSVTADTVEVSRVGGVVSARIDDAESDVPAEIAALLEGKAGDTAIVAHRFAGSAWVAELYAL